MTRKTETIRRGPQDTLKRNGAGLAEDLRKAWPALYPTVADAQAALDKRAAEREAQA